MALNVQIVYDRHSNDENPSSQEFLGVISFSSFKVVDCFMGVSLLVFKDVFDVVARKRPHVLMQEKCKPGPL